jgi:putative transposase
VTAHGVREEALFRCSRDRLQFLRELARTTARIEWTCIAYCLMRTHFHLIVHVEEGQLPRGMHALNFRYAAWFNVEHDYRGHVLSARYWSRRIEDEPDLLNVYAYVARNPVKAVLCDDPADWAWSSHPAAVGLRPADFVDPRAVLGCFDGPLELRMAELRRFVAGP